MPVGGFRAAGAARIFRFAAAACLMSAMAAFGLALLAGALALLILALVTAGLLFPRELRRGRAVWRRGAAVMEEWMNILRPRTVHSGEEERQDSGKGGSAS